MAKFIKCDCCGKRIPFGEEVYKFSGYAGLFCSGDCFAQSYGEVQELDDELADDCFHDVYDDEDEAALRKEIEETKVAITDLEAKLKCLEINLKAYK
jgi:hypothetical protein